LGYHSQIILSGRKINDGMGKYVAENLVKKMIQAKKQIAGSSVVIFGFTFKENCPDVRNTKVIDIIKELEEYGIVVKVVDPVADNEEILREYGIKAYKASEITDIDAVIFAVPHEEFRAMSLEGIKKVYRATGEGCNLHLDIMGEAAAASEDETVEPKDYVLIDVKGMFDREEAEKLGFLYWRL